MVNGRMTNDAPPVHFVMAPCQTDALKPKWMPLKVYYSTTLFTAMSHETGEKLVRMSAWAGLPPCRA